MHNTIQTKRKQQKHSSWAAKGGRHAPSKRQGKNIGVTSTSIKQRLLKTEMCRNMKLHGKCVHGNSCDFAHFEHEICSRTFSGRSSNGMIPYSHTNIHEYLARPCVDFVATGSW